MNKYFLRKRWFIPFLMAGVFALFLTLASPITSFAQSDADGDGIPDASDSCRNRGNEGGLGVDETGCPYYDADWDGVYDRNDSCPWRGDEYGFGIGTDGCPLTAPPANDNPETQEPSDNSPPSDEPSDDPETTQEPNATEEPNVTEEPWFSDRDEERDADWDGFPDTEDACPWRGNEGGLGVDETGCPYYDADWDGVYDRDDACPWRGDEYGFGIDETGCPNEATVTEEPTEEPTEPPPSETPEPPITGAITSPANDTSVYSPVDVTFSFNEPLPDGLSPFITIDDPLTDGEFVWLQVVEIGDNDWLLEAVQLGVFDNTCGEDFGIKLYIATDLPDSGSAEPQGTWELIDSITVEKWCDSIVTILSVTPGDYNPESGCTAIVEIQVTGIVPLTLIPFVHNNFYGGPWTPNNLGDEYPPITITENTPQNIQVRLGGRVNPDYFLHTITFQYPNWDLTVPVTAQCNNLPLP